MSAGNYYITEDSHGGLRALCLQKMWVEKEGEGTYRLCGVTADGYVMNLYEDESLKKVNRHLLSRAGVSSELIAMMEIKDADT